MTNKKFVSENSIINVETGEVIGARRSVLKIPEKISIEQKFRTVYLRAIESLPANLLGYLLKISQCIEFETNRIVEIRRGVRSKPARNEYISKLFGLSLRQTQKIIRQLKFYKAIYKHQGAYYVNPSFCVRSVRFETSSFEDLKKIDDQISNYLDKKIQWICTSLSRAEAR